MGRPVVPNEFSFFVGIRYSLTQHLSESSINIDITTEAVKEIQFVFLHILFKLRCFSHSGTIVHSGKLTQQ